MQNSLPTYNILIVEDSTTICNLIHKVLSKNKQYVIQKVDKIKWAKKALKKTYFDLICLDILLPDGNGINLCKTLREDSTYKNTKIIIISQITQAIDKVEAFKIGADEYIQKPFHPQELEIRIQKHLGLIDFKKPVLKYKNLKLDTVKMKFFHNNYEIHLTKTEFLIIKYFFQHGGFANLSSLTKFLSSKKITSVNNKSVIVSINRLKRKLNTNTGNPFIKTKYGIGYYIP